MTELIVIGGGLAGSEAAWQAANRGIHVKLFEMRPNANTGAHTGDYLAELVCSNSFGSNLIDRAPGLLKEEIRRLDSLLLSCAEKTAVPAGGALAVDRDAFAKKVTERIQNHPNIQLIREEIKSIPDKPAIIASGPLTSLALSQEIANLTGQDHLYFFDAIAPVVLADTIDQAIVYRASRYDRGEQESGDYLNCPLEHDIYEAFVDA